MGKGFTLIELTIVVAIIAILSGIAVQKFLDQTKKTKDANVYAILANYRSQKNIVETDDVILNDINELTGKVGVSNSIKVYEGKTSGTITSVQMRAGTVVLGNAISIGFGSLLGEENIVEISYNKVNEVVIADGVNDTVNYSNAVDTKNKKWNEY